MFFKLAPVNTNPLICYLNRKHPGCCQSTGVFKKLGRTLFVMNRSYQNNKLRSWLLLPALLVLGSAFTPLSTPATGNRPAPFTNTKGTNPGACTSCASFFPDDVATQARAYRSEGINPQKTDKGIKQLYRSGKLQLVASNSLYKVNRLYHSQPYLLAEGKAFLSELASRYKAACKAAGVSYVKFTLSSLTRSRQSVASLMEENDNSIANSAHLKGKTFDVSYAAFGRSRKQLKLFVAELKKMRAEGLCYVKYERNGCLHITVR